MNRADVANVLREEGVAVTADLHGFTLPSDPAERWRLKHGGGIAGRSNVWWVERVRDGFPLPASKSVKTRAALRRLLREYRAYLSMGQKPADQHHNGVTYRPYAKLHSRGMDQNYVWVMRPVKRRPLLPWLAR